MSHAEKCPVCEGKGKTTTEGKHGTTTASDSTCHGCNGKGWITVGMEDPVIYPTYPTYPVYPPYPDPWYPYTYPYPYQTTYTDQCTEGGTS